ncbi:hypothetical protein C806_01278 [Lachnospiraceae bacterium 3-1]|nr:hypothetical protein C806_01278 [Lachnospiraceae bacterium 3-1]
MYKRICLWLGFTVALGAFPLLFILVVKYVTKSEISISVISPELFFFNVMVYADGLKTLNDIKEGEKNKKVKTTLFVSVVIFLIFLSVIYGILLLNSNIPTLNLRLGLLNALSVIFTIICIIISGCIQVIGGLEDE